MKKNIMLVCAVLACGCMVFADDQRTVNQYDKSCTTVSGSFLGNGGSTTTCVTTYSDGSKKTTVESCTKTGASASAGIAKGGFERTNCKITEINEPANSNNQNKDNNNNNNNNSR